MARSAAALKVVDNDEPTIASLAEELANLAEKRRPFKQQAEAIDKQMTPLKNKLLPMMLKEGLEKAVAKHGSATVTRRESYEITDFDAMLKALKKAGFLHCLTLNTVQAREYEERMGKPIPGTELKVTTQFLTISGIGG